MRNPISDPMKVESRDSQTRTHFPPSWLCWSVWGIGAAFYLTGFYQRVSPAVMTGELMRDFHISAQQLGNLSAFYFYLYVAMQIPIGILIDRWGARTVLIGGAISAALGAFLFGSTHDFALACAGRAIVGGASAVGWLVILKLATHWFPHQRFAMLSGLGLFFGNIGALTAQVPLRLLIENFGWRTTVLASAAVILAMGILAWAIVENDPSSKGFVSYAPDELKGRASTDLRAVLAGFRRVFKYANTWLIFFAQGGMVGPVLAFTGLWGVPFLSRRYGLTAKSAAAVCSVMIICWAVASPVCGSLSDRIGRRKPIYLGGALISTVGWVVLFYLRTLPLTAFVTVAAITSLACGSGVLGFAYSKEKVPIRYIGTISGVTNIGNMLGPTLLQPAIGWMLDKRWTGEISNGSRVYGVGAFQAAFVLIVLWSTLSSILISLTKETYCEQNV
jgi:sugar phosphate permease